MAVVTGLTATRMLEIEAASVVDGDISSGHLILTKHDGSSIDAGIVTGPAASLNSGAPAAPIAGQMFFDTANFAGITDLMAASNPATSTANWLAYGYGYDTGVTFSLAGGGVTLTGGAGSGSHFAGIPLSGLVSGESYFALLKVRVPTGSPDVQFTVGYKTSGHLMKIKDQDVTLALAFTADGTSASFGVEFTGAGTVVVKAMKVYVLNQRGYPSYIYDGSGWVETVHMAQKGDIYSRVNTFGNQIITGTKQFNDALWVGPTSNAFFIAGSNSEAGALPIMQVSQDNSAGGFAGLAIRGGISSAAVGRSVGLLLKMSTEGSITESNKHWEIAAYSTTAYGNYPDFIVRNGYTGANNIYITGSNNEVAVSHNLTARGYIFTLGAGGTGVNPANVVLNGGNAGASGGGGGIYWYKNGVSKLALYTLGSDENLYVRDQANATMIAKFQPGTAGNTALFVYDYLEAPIIRASSNGLGTNFKVGDDVWLGDINVASTMGLKGVNNASVGYIKFGSDTATLGSAGSDILNYGGGLTLGANLSLGGNITGGPAGAGNGSAYLTLNCGGTSGNIAGVQWARSGTSNWLAYIQQVDTSWRLRDMGATPTTVLTIAPYAASTGNVIGMNGMVNVGTGVASVAGDLAVGRAGGTSGVVYLGPTTRYIYYNASTYVMPGANLVLNGTTVTSDRRVKTNIETLPIGMLDLLLKVRPTKFNRLSEDREVSPVKTYGVIAQEIMEIFPDLVSKTDLTMIDPNTPDGELSDKLFAEFNVDYNGLIPIMIKAIQEQQAQINYLMNGA